MKEKKWAVILFLFVLFFTFGQRANASSLYAGVAASDAGSDNTLSTSNTANKVAVNSLGTIFVAYHGTTQGVRIVRSTNRGQSFGTSIQLDTADANPEVVIDSNNIVYVVWVTGGNVKLSRSTDLGATYSAAATIGASGSSSVHIAVSTPYVYVLNVTGTTLFVNGAAGVGAFTTTTVDSTRVFASVLVDERTQNVYVQTDDPNVLYFMSTNHGQTFGASVQPNYDVHYSTAAITSSLAGRYIYVSGGYDLTDDSSVRINLTDNSTVTIPFTVTNALGVRSLAADNLGNVISGYTTAGGVGKYEVSTNYGLTVGTPVTVATSPYMSVGINSTYGDVVVAYESSGSIFVSVYSGELTVRSTTTSVTPATRRGVNPAFFALPNMKNVSLKINGGESTTQNPQVKLTIESGSDIKSMAVASTPNFYGVGIEPIASTKTLTLCTVCQPGQTYTVYLRLYTQNGQSSTITKNITYVQSVAKKVVKVSKPKRI